MPFSIIAIRSRTSSSRTRAQPTDFTIDNAIPPTMATIGIHNGEIHKNSSTSASRSWCLN